ncbi:S-acyl fatty acid synthase thioesterase, medium chain (plasmid) [Pantoea vagans C9-1]|uniref:thioesterase II family protein n=1 Tax=Pantoea vagans TaxID=470934 RepID=UPI0001E57992|nr:alpha/beta fold hydrolase [Pantoea vagans]ADO08151.1 S-acyl fatty acid synthase thioesterase, medium chain [Pantoea vagans C9-1]
MCLIFVLPHAGGGAHHYYGWAEHLSPEIQWEPLDYAGHFSRMDEPLYTTFEQAIQDLAGKIIDRACGQPFGLFGHSMGGALAYEISQYLTERQMAEDLLFIAISSALPSNRRDPGMTRYYELPDRDFIQHLIDTGGMTKQMAAESELMASYLPLIRQDYRLYHQYQSPLHPPLKIPLYTLWGNKRRIVTTICRHGRITVTLLMEVNLIQATTSTGDIVWTRLPLIFRLSFAKH